VSVDQGLIDWVSEALAPVGEVTMRRMMGGATLYCEGIIFAIVALDDLWFKADKVSDPIWDGEGADRFTYPRKDGKVGQMNYRRAPGDVHDDPEAMIRWAEIAIGAGRRSAK
jgi:DNA transformation protein